MDDISVKNMDNFKKNIANLKLTLQYLEDNYKNLGIEFQEEMSEQFYEGIHHSKIFCNFLECMIRNTEK